LRFPLIVALPVLLIFLKNRYFTRSVHLPRGQVSADDGVGASVFLRLRSPSFIHHSPHTLARSESCSSRVRN
jgi:hypothetical protein